MKKTRKVTLIAISIIAVFIANTSFAKCNFPDNPAEVAPAWVCSDLNTGDLNVSGFSHTAIGSAKKTDVGAYFDKDMAVFDARDRLAAKIRTSSARTIKRFLGVSGVNASTIDKYIERVSIQFSQAVIENSVTLATTISSNGDIYVLIGIRETGSKKVVKKLRTSLNDDRAQYQQELGKEAFEKLEKRIEKAEKNPDIMSDSHYQPTARNNYFRDEETGELVKVVKESEVAKGKAAKKEVLKKEVKKE